MWTQIGIALVLKCDEIEDAIHPLRRKKCWDMLETK